jgi:formylglycine-generating enzyme required for sulfatase activity
MPNDFGIFDSLSNAFEWCQDPYVNSQLKPNSDQQESAFRGGSATEGLRFFQSASYFNMDVKARSFQQGIRLVYDAE